jgi:hypothetical protein
MPLGHAEMALAHPNYQIMRFTVYFRIYNCTAAFLTNHKNSFAAPRGAELANGSVCSRSPDI